jgi:hypothetical protein
MLPPAAEDEQSESEPQLPSGISDWGDGEAGLGEEGLGDGELASVVAQIAELAQLGLGDADRMYPQTMDEYYQAVADEQAWRVVL